VAGGPGSSLPGYAALGDTISTLGTSYIMDPGATNLGLSSFLSASSPPANWRQVEGGMELACSWVVARGQLLREVLIMASRDILHPVQVCPEEGKSFT
jgi:hypothetical protein